MKRPLNPDLFDKLTRVFGRVEIRGEGESMRGQYVQRGNRREFVMDVPGEYYSVCCPFCRDTRFRLWVHHRWGVPDSFNNCRWWSAHCFNEQCLAEYANLRTLIGKVYGGLGRDQRSRVRIRPGTSVPGPQQIVLPGICPRVDELPEHHPAAVYLLQRHLDPQVLAPTYDLRFCQQSGPQFTVAQGRLVIPVRMRGQLVGWQARFLGEADWHIVPKYYSAPGMRRSRFLYNFDLARLSPVVFITEGVTDAWAVGKDAVALLGKTASSHQKELIAATWRHGAAVVLLDSDAHAEAERLTTELRRQLAHGAVHVELPAGSDPASLPRERLWELIWAVCVRSSIDLIELLRRTRSQ